MNINSKHHDARYLAANVGIADELPVKKDIYSRVKRATDYAVHQKVKVRTPQKLFDDYALFHKGQPATAYFNGQHYFNHPVLDKVFKEGSGNITATQKQMLENIRHATQRAYQLSSTFRKILDQRQTLIGQGISPPVTVIPLADDWHMSRAFNTRDCFSDNKEGYVAINGKYLTHNSEQYPSFYLGESKDAVELKPDSFERVVMHEIVHALTHSLDSERNTAAGEERYAQVMRAKRQIIYSVDESKDFSDAHKVLTPTKSDFFKIVGDDIPGLAYEGDVYCSKVNLIGENDALVNTIFREMDPQYKPLLVYGPLTSYWQYEGQLLISDELSLDIDDQHQVLTYLLQQDQGDGELNYPFSFFSQNRKRQVSLDAANLHKKIILP
jgi:hypothetical protein